jgi:hypothetical protein
MKRSIWIVAFGLAGLALAVGLTLGAFALAGGSLSEPAKPMLITGGSVVSPGPSSSDDPTGSPGPSETPSGKPSPSPADDHVGGSGGEDGGNSGSSGSGSGGSEDSGGSGDSSGSDSGSSEDEPGDDD